MKKTRILYLSLVGALILGGCAGPNPNPGERTTDTAWETGNYARSLEIAKRYADWGMPWAELRMGQYYDTGTGVEEDVKKALYWYMKAARHNIEGKWAEGYIAGAMGKAGHFGERNDALIAQYLIAQLYLNDNRIQHDYVKAYLLANHVLKKANGSDLFFCCDWSGGRWFTLKMVKETIAKAESKLTNSELEKAKQSQLTWSLDDL